LRPDYQIEKLGPLAHRADRIQSIATVLPPKSRPVFPTERKAQAGQVLELLSRTRSPLSANEIASRFRDSSQAEDDIRDVLTSLGSLGYVETFDNGRSYMQAVS
jgi:hypothetical protein